MIISMKKLNGKQLEQVACSATPCLQQFLSSMLALPDPFKGTQVNIGKRRFGLQKGTGRVIHPLFVPIEEAGVLLKGDKEHVVALGNGGHSDTHEPEEWFAGSVFGEVNGKVPFTFSQQGSQPLVYAAPTLVLGRENQKVEVAQIEVEGPVTLSDITRALRTEGTAKHYGILECSGTDTDASAKYTTLYTYTYVYAPQERSAATQSNGPLTLLLSANSHDTHGIRENGDNIHVNEIGLSEKGKARGLVFSLI